MQYRVKYLEDDEYEMSSNNHIERQSCDGLKNAFNSLRSFLTILLILHFTDFVLYGDTQVNA